MTLMEHIDKIDGTFDRRAAEIKSTVSVAVIKRLPRYHRYLYLMIETRLTLS